MTLMTEKPVTSTFSTPQLSRLNVALAPLHEEYDSADRSLRKPFSSPGYHTTLKGGEVHPTRESLEYAVAILDVVDPEFQTRSEEIVRRIVAEQDQNPESKTYGIWSWFLDEPLTQMSPPDWNWADFCGVQLLQIALFHRDRFDSDTMKLIDTAIVHAARSIERRNVGPHYTNIAVMGTYVTLIAAQLYDLADLKTYALNRLKRFHEYTQYNGGFSEFNSPTYTTVVLKELGRLRRDVRLAEARDLVEDLYIAAWEEIAVHFHVPTRQWGGPHSRWYRSLMDDATLGLIERSVRRPLHWGKVSTFPSIEEHRLLLPCPQHLESHFAEVGEARQIVKTFQRDTPLLVGTTFLTPHFTLGSINALDLWNQRRSLLAYWGNAEQPTYLRLRFMHDGYDFAAAQYFSVQDKGNVLAGISFATNGGDTHPMFDRLTNGNLPASDLRVRFEIGGNIADLSPTLPAHVNGPLQLSAGGVHVEISSPVAQFGDCHPIWQTAREANLLNIDLVIYSGPSKKFSLPDLEAVIALTVSLSTNPRPFETADHKYAGTSLLLKWRDLSLRFPSKPNTVDALQKEFHATQTGG